MTYIAFERRLKTKFNASVPNWLKCNRSSIESAMQSTNSKTTAINLMSNWLRSQRWLGPNLQAQRALPVLKSSMKWEQLCQWLDIDTAHRVPTKSDRGSGPKLIICKFVKRLAKEQVMEVRNNVINVNPTAIPEQTFRCLRSESLTI